MDEIASNVDGIASDMDKISLDMEKIGSNIMDTLIFPLIPNQ